MKTFGQLRTAIRADIWPGSEAENLVDQHNNQFEEGAADISKWVDCEQESNVNLIDFCKTFFKCGMTVVPAPAGIIKRVYVVADTDYCDPVYYTQRPWPDPEFLGKGLIASPTGLGKPSLPMGFRYAESSTDKLVGATKKRARVGIWAVHDRNIYIAPWINSDEFVAIEWTGIKKEWKEGDIVNDALDYRRALKLFVQYAHERDYGSMQKAREFLVRMPGRPDTGLYADALGDLMYQCREQTKVRETATSKQEQRTLFPAEFEVLAQASTFFNPVIVAEGEPTSPPPLIDQNYLYKDSITGVLYAWDVPSQSWI